MLFACGNPKGIAGLQRVLTGIGDCYALPGQNEDALLKTEVRMGQSSRAACSSNRNLNQSQRDRMRSFLMGEDFRRLAAGKT